MITLTSGCRVSGTKQTDKTTLSIRVRDSQLNQNSETGTRELATHNYGRTEVALHCPGRVTDLANDVNSCTETNDELCLIIGAGELK